MRTYPCGWVEKISAYFDGEGSAWERWLCGRHLRHCGACRIWLRETESGWHRLRAGLRGPADAALIENVMRRVRTLPAPQPAPARPARAASTWLRPLTQAAAAGAGLLALGAVILPPLFSRRDLLMTSCQSNLRHIGVALSMYAADYDDRLPPQGVWTAAVTGEPGAARWLRCPGDATRALWPSYGFHNPLAGQPLDAIASRGNTPLVFEGRRERFIPRHRRLGNVMFADFHLAAVHKIDFLQSANVPY